jgi:hypothetical protein
MSETALTMSLDEIKSLIFQLPAREFFTLVDAIEARAETIAMMQLAETGFQEWNEEGEGIYDICHFSFSTGRGLGA